MSDVTADLTDASDTITIHYRVDDALDTPLPSTLINWTGANAAARAVIDNADGGGSDRTGTTGAGSFNIPIKRNATPGEYVINLTSDAEDDNDVPLASGTVTITLKGAATQIVGRVHTCSSDSAAEDNETLMCDGTGTSAGMSPDAATGTPEFEWGDDIYVVGYHADAAGNPVGDAIGTNTNNKVRWSMTPVDRNITPSSQTAASGANAFDGVQEVAIGLGAMARTYTVTFVDGRTDVDAADRLPNATAMFTVAEEPPGVDSYTVTGPSSVVDGSATYTVSALDANGGSPQLRATDTALAGADADYVNNKVRVFVSGSGAQNVILLRNGVLWEADANGNRPALELDVADAMETFSMEVLPGTARGEVIFTVRGEGPAVATVRSARHSVTIGPEPFASSVTAEQCWRYQCHQGGLESAGRQHRAGGDCGQRGGYDGLLSDDGGHRRGDLHLHGHGRTAGATYVALVIALHAGGDGYTLGNVVRVILPAASSGS